MTFKEILKFYINLYDLDKKVNIQKQITAISFVVKTPIREPPLWVDN